MAELWMMLEKEYYIDVEPTADVSIMTKQPWSKICLNREFI